MAAVLQRIEALAGERRYAVTFLVTHGLTHGGEQSAVAEVADGQVLLAAAALPAGWDLRSAAHEATVRAVLALHEARTAQQSGTALVDVDGGWDVGMGNVVLDPEGRPECVAHGGLIESADGIWQCPECGARAQLG